LKTGSVTLDSVPVTVPVTVPSRPPLPDDEVDGELVDDEPVDGAVLAVESLAGGVLLVGDDCVDGADELVDGADVDVVGALAAPLPPPLLPDVVPLVPPPVLLPPPLADVPRWVVCDVAAVAVWPVEPLRTTLPVFVAFAVAAALAGVVGRAVDSVGDWPVWARTMSPPDGLPDASVSPAVFSVPWLSRRLPTTAPSASTAPAATPVRALRVARERVAGWKPSRSRSWATEMGPRR
jgi:hypothetical protein